MRVQKLHELIHHLELDDEIEFSFVDSNSVVPLDLLSIDQRDDSHEIQMVFMEK